MNKIFTFLLLITLLLTGCAKKEARFGDEVLELGESYVSQIGGTSLGRLEEITIDFSEDIKGSVEKAIILKPKQKGSWSVAGARAVFTPSKPYPAEKQITLTADCKKLFGLEKEAVYVHKYFTDSVRCDVKFNSFELNDDGKDFTLKGTFTTDIPAAKKDLKKCLKAKFGSFGNLKITWKEPAANNKVSVPFFIEGISLGKKVQTLNVFWNGRSLGVKKNQGGLSSGKKEFKIPTKDEFTIFNINDSEKDKIVLSFSKELAPSQNISAFIKTTSRSGENADAFRASVFKNVLTIYGENNFSEITQVAIESGIKSKDGALLAMGETIMLNDAWENPSVEFASNGVILPTSQGGGKGTTIPVKTKNLNGLLIQAFMIHDWNITQFLQNNDLDGKNSLSRVGEPVWEKNVSFEWRLEMKNKFITTGIDLTELLKKYPDGMLQLRVSFRKENIKYVCNREHPDFSEYPMPPNSISGNKRDKESSYWDYMDEVNDMPYEKRSTYWRYKNDPCHPAYYMSNYNSKSLIERNVLVSDIGLLAKKDAEGNLYVTASDLKTAKPLSGAEITLANYVGRKLGVAKTNSDGSAVFKNPDGEVFAVFAKSGKQNSYLKLSGGTELSVSHFETGGEKAANGVKGFIYGERGVWRPGDDLFLTFVLQDLNNAIPKDFPATFELQDPTGRIAESRTIKENVNGFYPIKTSTNANAPTGFWLARVKIGGNEWTRSLKIETVVPNKLSVKLDSSEELLESGMNNFTLKGEWLHGAATPNYKADVSMTLFPTESSFENYPEYSFSNPQSKFSSSRDTVWEGNLDENSKANLNIELRAGANAPGKLKANFTSRIFEPSGAFSSETKSFTFSPYQRYCGIKTPKGDAVRGMLLTDTEHTADVVLLDANGKGIDSAELNYAIYKLEWKWWWEKDALTDATYVSYESSALVNNGKFYIQNGKGSFTFRVDYPSWGRYLVLVSDGRNHSAGKIVYIDWPNWAGRAQENGSDSASMLTLSTDKKNYNVGETAQISFASGKDARALVTIEKSGAVVKQEWIETKAETTSYKLPLTNAMTPNVYVHVTLLQPHNQTANSLPIRLYGVVPIKVEDPATILVPVITTAEKFEPHKNCSISVSEKSGKEMTYTLAVVDEGLLGLTNFHAPNLHDEFYKKEASMLSSYDLYKYVMNAYSGKLETLLAIGGSDGATTQTNLDANRFTPVVKFFGPFALKAGEKKATQFEMPGYIGAVRAIVIAGNKGAYGVAEKSVKVKSDLMVHSALPRTLGLSETIDAPVTIFNGTDKAQSVSVSLKAKGAEITGQSEKTISVKANDNATLPFTVKMNAEGTAEFSVTAKMPGAQTVATIPVAVQSRGVPITLRETFIVKEGETYEARLDSNVQSGTAKNTVELSTLPQMNMSERLKSLITYPHGCIEQITSGGFPQLYLPGFLKLSAKETEEIKANVNSVLTRHKNYRTSSGALAYWPGESVPSTWGSCYAAHFELEAKNAGYDVDENLLNPLLDWIATSAASWNAYASDSYENGTGVQAYKLFVLALAGKADIASMNRLSDGVAGTENTTARLLLSCAYSLAGQRGAAIRLLRGIEFSRNKFRETGGAFNSNIRERAMYLFACEKLGFDDADGTAREVAETLCSDEWLNTQEISWSLIALLPRYKNQGGEKASYSITAEGVTRNGTVENGMSIENVAASAGETQKALIENTGKKTLYGTFVMQGISIPGKETLDPKNPQNLSSHLNLDVKYLSDAKREIDPTALKAGENFRILVNVKNKTNAKVKNLALTLPIPTCWEIANERLALNADDYSNTNSAYTHQDIRDDNIYTYFDLNESESKSFTFSATVVYSGEYFIPAVQVQAMYDNEFAAIQPGKRATTLQ